jgi:V-type H+-transporting ATPase subunit E
MSKQSGLSREQCRERTNHIADSILSEAREQARMIEEEGDKLAQDEKKRIFDTETSKLKREATRKGKQMNAQDKIDQSKAKNIARLSVLTQQEVLMQGALDAASVELGNVHSSASYSSLLEGLILQALVKLNERRVTVQCLARDSDKVRQAGAAASKKYTEPVELVYSDTPLPVMEAADTPCLGGVVLWSENGHICCKNTLNVRLEFVADTKMPSIKALMFPDSAAPAQTSPSVDDLLM